MDVKPVPRRTPSGRYIDRRQHPRVNAPLAVQYRPQGSSSLRPGVLLNLSAGGAAMVTRETLVPGTKLRPLRVDVSQVQDGHEAAFEAAAIVHRVDHRSVKALGTSPVVGLRFTEVEARGQSLIRELGRQRTDESLQPSRAEFERQVECLLETTEAEASGGPTAAGDLATPGWFEQVVVRLDPASRRLRLLARWADSIDRPTAWLLAGGLVIVASILLTVALSP